MQFTSCPGVFDQQPGTVVSNFCEIAAKNLEILQIKIPLNCKILSFCAIHFLPKIKKICVHLMQRFTTNFNARVLSKFLKIFVLAKQQKTLQSLDYLFIGSATACEIRRICTWRIAIFGPFGKVVPKATIRILGRIFKTEFEKRRQQTR